MALQKSFPKADLLDRLEQLGGSLPVSIEPELDALLLQRAADGHWELSAAGRLLLQWLRAQAATLQAVVNSEQVADQLRRYQKFARPGRPSAQIVLLRQRQAAARQATNQARQALLKSAAGFVHAAGLVVPARVTLEAFVFQWIDTHDVTVQATAKVS